MRSQTLPWKAKDGVIDSLVVVVGGGVVVVADGGVLVGSCFRVVRGELHLGHCEGMKREKIHERNQSGTCCNANQIVGADNPSAVDGVAVAAVASGSAVVAAVAATASDSVAGDEGGTGPAAVAVVVCHSSRSSAGDIPGGRTGPQSTHHTTGKEGSKRQGRSVHRDSWERWEKERRSHKQEKDEGPFGDGSTSASGHCPQPMSRHPCWTLAPCSSSLAREAMLLHTPLAEGWLLVCPIASQGTVGVVAVDVLLQTRLHWRRDNQTSAAAAVAAVVVVGGVGGTSRWVLSWGLVPCQKVIQRSQCGPQLIQSGQCFLPLRYRRWERTRSWDQRTREQWEHQG